MSDDVDRANDLAAFDLNVALINHRKSLPDVESADWCEVCGGQIPEARRKALPGVQHCVDCANEEERKARLMR